MDLLLGPTHTDLQYVIANINKSVKDCDDAEEEISTLLPEPILIKNPQRVLSTKLKNRHGTISEVPEEEIQGNPIGMLQELCMMRRWMPPDYSTEQEEGLPHERLFTILCAVGIYKEYGVGRSKKLAKRQAAHKMVQKILTIPAEDDTTFKNLDEDEDEIIERFSNQKGNRASTTNNGIRRKISSFHKNLKSLTGTKTEKLKNMNIYELQNIDAVKLLKDVAVENKLDVTCVHIDEKSKSDKYQCLVQLSTLPVVVCHGTANSTTEAQKQASVRALKHIQILSK